MLGSQDVSDTRQVVAIESVNPEEMTASGVCRWGSRVMIRLSLMVGGIRVIPEPGEQWLVEKTFGYFILVARVDFQDPRKLQDTEVGTVMVGGTKSVILFGDSVTVEAPKGLVEGGVGLGRPPLCRCRGVQSKTGVFSPVLFTEITLDKTNSFTLQGGSLKTTQGGIYDIRVSSSASSVSVLVNNIEVLSSPTSNLIGLTELTSGSLIEVKTKTDSLVSPTVSLEVVWRSH